MRFARFSTCKSPAVAEVTLQAFSTRLIRPSNDNAQQEFLLLHERILVTDAIRALVLAGADEDAIHRRAIADGMRSLRRTALDQVDVGRLTSEAVATLTPDD